LPGLVAGALCLAVILGGCSGAASATPEPGSTKALADAAFHALIARQAMGHATAAAYVETTLGDFQAQKPPEQRQTADGAAADDRVIVIKVYGDFPSAHSGPRGANTDANVIVQCYDIELSMPVETTYLLGPEPGDLPGAPLTAGVSYVDLRKLGTPVALQP
jgi:hypothetical protein